MSWDDLSGTRGWLTIRPLSTWPGALTRGRRRAQFRAGWPSTRRLLMHELTQLAAKGVVLEMAITEDDLHQDGLPRPRSVAAHPGVVLSLQSKHGPLRYAVDSYTRWHDNLRAIGLSLEALRAVDRYGVTRAGEQYRGWRAIEAGPSGQVERGRELIAQHGGVTAALHATHPDRGGAREDLEAVLAARESGA